jgi:hypothetical protein
MYDAEGMVTGTTPTVVRLEILNGVKNEIA